MAIVQNVVVGERKRVKVYELRANDWFDRGTGFCGPHSIQEDASILVEAEDEPERLLLDARIRKEDTFQKQQETLIVWTDAAGTDMALSFQEADGCAMIWELINDVQARMTDGPDNDGLPSPPSLPPAQIGNLEAIEDTIRKAANSQQARETVLKLIFAENYIAQLTSLVAVAEDLQSLDDLHRLCNIMKLLILFNDSNIIEFVVRDEQVLGFVGALEYDPDFPHHKANHRQYLSDSSKYKEVVPMPDPEITQKIHITYRLQYLKDVVLARILDDPAFNILNSLIFFNQVDIVQHIQTNQEFLRQLIGVISSPESEPRRRRDGVLFIQQCCAIAKGIQIGTKTSLYSNLIACGLFSVISFALQHPDAAVRVAGTDVLVAMVDHDALMIRAHINKAVVDKAKPLTDTLIDLFLVESDLGVKSQIADAMKVLLDTNPTLGPGPDRPMGENGSMFAKFRPNPQHCQQNDQFLENFYSQSAKNLFKPLRDLISRKSLDDVSIQEVSLYSHLVEILGFLVRQTGQANSHRSKYFILSEGLSSRVAQLMTCSEKHLKLAAVKYFRVCIGLNDEFYTRQLIQHRLFEPILALVEQTMSRDNLLNSACLELFEFVKRETVRPAVLHLVENYRERLMRITYVATFHALIQKYEEMKNPPPPARAPPDTESSFMTTDSDTPNTRHVTINGGGVRWQQSQREADADEEAYLNASDDDDDELARDSQQSPTMRLNGSRNAPDKPLVAYDDDDDDDDEDDDDEEDDEDDEVSGSPAAAAGSTPEAQAAAASASPNGSPATSPAPASQLPPRPASALSEKRRRDDDDDDELSKLSGPVKRRSSVASLVDKTGLSTPASSNSASAPAAEEAAPAAQAAQASPLSDKDKTMPTRQPSRRVKAAAAAKNAAAAAAAAASGNKITISLSSTKVGEGSGKKHESKGDQGGSSSGEG